MKVDSSNVFSDKTQDSCVEEIISTLKNDNLPQSSFKVDFHLSKGKMLCIEDHNTVLSFDTKSNTVLKNVLNYICEVENVGEGDIEKFNNFKDGIISRLNSNSNKETLKGILREKVFKGASEDIIPISTLEVRDIEISDLPDVDYVLVIKKMAPVNYQLSSISDDLFKEHYDTSEDFNEIIQRKKDSGDEKYKYIDSVEKRKTFFEVTIPIFADYSAVAPREKKDDNKSDKK